MFKLQAFNPLTGNTLANDWTLEGFQDLDEACKMIELLVNEGFEEVKFAGLMSEFEVRTWVETGAMAGLPVHATPAQVWAMRYENRPFLLPVGDLCRA